MSHEDIIQEKLAQTLRDLGGKLEALRESLQALGAAVPMVPDAAQLAAELGASLPEPEPPAPPPPAPAAAPAAAPLNNTLLYQMATLEFAETQVDILKHFMEAAQDHAARGVLYIIKGDQAQAWSGFGFPTDVKAWRADLGADPLLKTLVAGRNRMLLDDTLPGFIPLKGNVRRSLISPLLLKGKPAAFFYADSGAEGKLDHYSLDILLRTASLVIDILPLRPKREPLPAVLENQDIVLPGAAPSAPPPREEESQLFEDTGTLASPEPAASETAVAEIPMPELVPEPEPVPAAPPPPAEAPIPPGEEKAHEDAKRFARLLVQEIALYHPKELDEGRVKKNLYHLLRDDIDRSREAYEQRFASKPSILQRGYFRLALVKHLADGDASALGD